MSKVSLLEIFYQHRVADLIAVGDVEARAVGRKSEIVNAVGGKIG
jgi:hypothetical protein